MQNNWRRIYYIRFQNKINNKEIYLPNILYIIVYKL